MNKSIVTKIFLTVITLGILAACYLIYEPFLVEILLAAILVSVFYRPYQWLARKLNGRKHIASLIMCIIVVLLIIFPLTNLIIMAAEKSVEAYSGTVRYLNSGDWEKSLNGLILDKAQIFGLDKEAIRSIIVDMAGKSSDWLVSGATGLVKGTTSFFISLILIILTMFFFFTDGKDIMEKVMRLTPLPNKYDRQIFKKFRDVSFSIFVSTFAVALAQSFLMVIIFAIFGLPTFFPAIATAIFSMIPYMGAFLVWLPAGIYLLATGHIIKGVIMLIYGATIISTSDNIIRTMVIRGKAQVHPLFVFFSILGGISLLGFWGIFIGPLIISLAVTVLDIYEKEYAEVLEK